MTPPWSKEVFFCHRLYPTTFKDGFWFQLLRNSGAFSNLAASAACGFCSPVRVPLGECRAERRITKFVEGTHMGKNNSKLLDCFIYWWRVHGPCHSDYEDYLSLPSGICQSPGMWNLKLSAEIFKDSSLSRHEFSAAISCIWLLRLPAINKPTTNPQKQDRLNLGNQKTLGPSLGDP